ncbi:DNA polymerase delta small subunit isoform X2 [Cephus cinctus]|uniref:DNA polymerase delta small subunit isoform X2 n=1 Tax=Cephus cinctus TaxID=211228 RepID=A0AAJ7BTG4_CEPCN|nr:DNA polymerase delta small subunit isoform X2 [Cephus cinctus]
MGMDIIYFTGQVHVLQLTQLATEDMFDNRCILIGTLYKHQELKPSILRELSEELQIAASPPSSYYYSDKDYVYLEDEMMRVKLTGNYVNTKDLVTGLVCAVLGHAMQNGSFWVEDYCFPGCCPKVSTSNLTTKINGKLLLVSGLDFVNYAQSMAFKLLVEYMTGTAGNRETQEEEASIVRVIIAGNSIRSSAEIHMSKGHARNKAQDLMVANETSIAVNRFDSFLNQIVQCCCVTLMPGQYDPTCHSMPQQPIHPCMLPKSSRYKSLHGATNPWIGRIGNRIVSGSSGQPIEDIMKVVGISKVCPLIWLERTLDWRNYAPTAPDTLPAYPYFDKDPFVMQECPDIYFVSNMEKYESKLYKGQEGQTVRLICVPEFSKTHTAILVDLQSLDTRPISFGGIS